MIYLDYGCVLLLVYFIITDSLKSVNHVFRFLLQNEGSSAFSLDPVTNQLTCTIATVRSNQLKAYTLTVT